MRYITIYAVLNPTPKGVGYVLASYLTYFRNPKFIAPRKWETQSRKPALSECGSKAPAFSENVEKNEKRLSPPKKQESFYEKRELSLANNSDSFALAL